MLRPSISSILHQLPWNCASIHDPLIDWNLLLLSVAVAAVLLWHCSDLQMCLSFMVCVGVGVGVVHKQEGKKKGFLCFVDPIQIGTFKLVLELRFWFSLIPSPSFSQILACSCSCPRSSWIRGPQFDPSVDPSVRPVFHLLFFQTGQ